MRTDRQKALVAGLATIGMVAVAFGSQVGPEWTPGRPESAGALGDAISLGGLSLVIGACLAYWATAPQRDFRGSARRRAFAQAEALASADSRGAGSAVDPIRFRGGFRSDGAVDGGVARPADDVNGPADASQPASELAVMPDPGRRSTPDRRTVADRRSASDRRATRRPTPDRRAYSVLYSDADPYPDPLPHGRTEPSAASTAAATTAVQQALAAAAAIAQAAGAPGTTTVGPNAKADRAATAEAGAGAQAQAETEAGEQARTKPQTEPEPRSPLASLSAEMNTPTAADPTTSVDESSASGRRSQAPGSLIRRTRSLDRVNRDARIGQAAENYVGAIVKRVGRASHDVKQSLMLRPPDISFHHGDVDFLLVGRDEALSFLLEVKATNPDRRGGAEGEKHAAQAARGRRAVMELTRGAVNPVPIVVYVDPIGSRGDTLMLRPLRSSETHAGVWSVGAKGLEPALRTLARDLARSRR